MSVFAPDTARRRIDLPTALAIAFAWGPAIDLVTELLWIARGSTGASGRLGLALVALAARYATARFAFRARTFAVAAIRLAVPTLVLGVALRLIALAPLLSDVSAARRAGVLLPNLAFPSALTALYAAALPFLLHRRGGADRPPRDVDESIAVAAVWVALAPAAFTHFGLWAVAWRPPYLGVDGGVRWLLGAVAPLVISMAVTLAAASSGDRLRRMTPVILAWVLVPASLAYESLVAAMPVLFVLDPFVAATARTSDGTLLVITETPDDPFDVFLGVRRPDGAWTRLPLVRAEPPWPARIDLTAGGDEAVISSFGVIDAVVDWRTGVVDRRAPLTWFKSPRATIADPFVDR